MTHTVWLEEANAVIGRIQAPPIFNRTSSVNAGHVIDAESCKVSALTFIKSIKIF